MVKVIEDYLRHITEIVAIGNYSWTNPVLPQTYTNGYYDFIELGIAEDKTIYINPYHLREDIIIKYSGKGIILLEKFKEFLIDRLELNKHNHVLKNYTLDFAYGLVYINDTYYDYMVGGGIKIF